VLLFGQFWAGQGDLLGCFWVALVDFKLFSGCFLGNLGVLLGCSGYLLRQGTEGGRTTRVCALKALGYVLLGGLSKW